MTQEKRDSVEEKVENPQLEDFGAMSLNQLLNFFQELIARADQQEMYKYADLVKSSFYKRLKREMAAHSAASTSTVDSSITNSEPQLEEGSDTVSTSPFAELERGFKELYGRYKLERRVYIEKLEREKEENLHIKNAIIEELKELLEKQEDLHHTFPAFRELQNRWRTTGPVPAAKSRDLWERYQHFVERFYDFVKINNELKELDLKKNLELKTKICEKAEALATNKNVVDAFHKLQKLHDDWREIGPVPKEVREEIWLRFKESSREINKRQQSYFEAIKEEQKANLEKKRAICEKIETLLEQEPQRWNFKELTKEVSALQEEWRTIGFATKKENQKIYDRFRASCDKFYNEKRSYFSKQKERFSDNLKAKIELCEVVESLQESDDWRKSTDKIIAAQKKWREIGPVHRRESDAIWMRFRKACDHFFERKEEHYLHKDTDLIDNLNRKEAILEQIKKVAQDSEKIGDPKLFQQLSEAWNSIGFVPKTEKERIGTSYVEAMREVFPDLFSEKEHNQQVKFKQQLTKVAARGDRGVRYERDKLLQKFRALEQDIALWENNIGFFAKSKRADSIIKEMNEKIEKAKEEMVQIEKKIKIIDIQFD